MRARQQKQRERQKRRTEASKPDRRPTKDKDPEADIRELRTAQLQQEWVTQEHPDCRHDMLRLLMSEEEIYLIYGCIACGEKIPVDLE